MIYAYDLLLFLLLMPAFLFIALRYRKKLFSDFFYKAEERFGIWKTAASPASGKPSLWAHCASLGEVRAVEPVLRRLQGRPLIITAVTPAGRRYAETLKLSEQVHFVPLDFSFLTGRAFRRSGASALLLVETELWPGLIHAASGNGAKIFLVNARLSARSYPWYKLFSAFWKPVIGQIGYLCARSGEDAERFKSLGFPEERIINTGNIKYDVDPEPQTAGRSELGFAASDIIWVCGSTRNGENGAVIEAWKAAKKDCPTLKLVIAPRHLNRAGEIAKILASSGIDFEMRSKNGSGSSACLIVDTFGELRKYYSICDMAFVGGSLVRKGGQNPIEPAAYAKPVIFGPHMENFLSEAAALGGSGGGFKVKDAAELAQKVRELAGNSGLRAQSGENALKAVNAQKGAVARTVEIINSALDGAAGGGQK